MDALKFNHAGFTLASMDTDISFFINYFKKSCFELSPKQMRYL